MDPYDSDSSGLEDEGDYTETGVLLGYASEEVIDDNISHLGGWPTWLDESTPPPGDFANCKVCNRPMLLLLELHGDLPENFPDDERRLYIFACQGKACIRKPGSIRALRASRKFKVQDQASPQPQKKESASESETTSNDTRQKQSEPTPQAPKQDLGASLFGTNSLTGSLSANPNPFSSSSSATQNNNPFAAPSTTTEQKQKQPAKTPTATTISTLPETFAEKVRLSSPPPPPPSSTKPTPPTKAAGPPKPWPPKSAFPNPYPHYYLDAEYETLSRPSTPSIPANVTMETADEDNANSKGGAGAELKDTFESELDKAFIRFSTRLAHNPEQVLRYEFGGSPLLYTYGDQVGKRLHVDPTSTSTPNGNGNTKVTTTGGKGGTKIPPCETCGSNRVFELQLVPHAISVLEEGRDGVITDGMEWGTIILGVCARNCCGPEGNEVGTTVWREEWVGVQWEDIK